jgi:predicted dehydrogenase
MKKVNLGLIGLGYIGKVHLKNCLKLEDANVVAVSDVSKKVLNLAEKMGVKKTFTDYRLLLKEQDIDAVIISLPTYLHTTCAISAAEEKKHIFLEKPLARNPEEGRQIVSAVRKHDVKLMVGYPFKFASSFHSLKKKLKSGRLGEVQVAHAINISTGPFFHRAHNNIPRPIPTWWFKKELTGGGALMDLGSHMINLTRWYFGEANNIKAYLGHRFNLETEDYAICIVNFSSGTTAIINVGWFSQETKLGVEFFGTVAHASAYHFPPSRILTAVQTLLGRTPRFYMPHLSELKHFVYCIKEDLKPLSSGEEALKDLKVIERAYENSEKLIATPL